MCYTSETILKILMECDCGCYNGCVHRCAYIWTDWTCILKACKPVVILTSDFRACTRGGGSRAGRGLLILEMI